MSADISLIEERAIEWTVRARDADFHDWDALTFWLEADAAHSEAFERVSLIDAMVPDLLPSKKPQWTARLARPLRWPSYRINAVAATVLAAVGLSFFMAQPSVYSIETTPGQRQTIALADGSQIELNGDTKITLTKGEPRRAVLHHGEAHFTIAHNARDPFIVKVGDAVVQDAGTMFNIIRAGNQTEVGVSEGLVIYNPEQDQIALKPGNAVRAVDGMKGPETFDIPRAAVGSWQRGQLTYNGATLGRVAADVSRSLGVKIAISSSAKSMRFTGTLNLKKDIDPFFEDAAPVLGVRARRTKEGWILVGGDETSR